MKMNRKMREAALTAMITLALSGSALAMPSGGNVVQGNVSVNGAAASAIADVASGATIAANGNSIIDWQAFGIKAGESLNFDTAKGALLNRVVGNNISEILGTLTQSGDNPLLLVNPNGILVGGGATINASQLVLSTLALSNDDFNKFANGTGPANFVTDNKGAASIMVEKGANFNIDEVLLMAGGTVNVADGVQFSVGNAKDGMVEITAADQITVDRTQKLQDSMDKIVINKDNAVSFHGTIDTTKGTGNTNVHIDGGTVNLDNATVKLNDKSQAYLVAGNKAENSATADNVLSGNKLTIEGGNETVIAGGKVTLENAKVESNGKISVGAGTSFGRDEGKDENNIVAAKASTDNEVVVKDSSLRNRSKEIQVSGGKITVDNSKIESNDTVAVNAYKDRGALNKHDVNNAFENGNTVTLKNNTSVQAKNTVVVTGNAVEKSATSSVQSQKDLTIADRSYTGTNITPTEVADSETTGYAAAPEAKTLTSTPTEEPQPQPEPKPQPEPQPQPTPAPTPAPQQSLSEDVKESIQKGEKDMGDIIGGDRPLADKQSAADKMVRELSNTDATERAKAGVVLGMLNQIKNDTSMTLAEKQVMQLTVLNAYEPAKNAKTANEQAKTAEGSRVAGQAVDTQRAQAVTSANESADDVAVNASAVTE